MADCLASIERGDFGASPAAETGERAGCPFCKARCEGQPTSGTQVVLLNGVRAGSVYYTDQEILPSPSMLLAAMPLNPLPMWLAPFDLRFSFILDELSVWFCNQGIVGDAFHWSRTNILMLASTCWAKRIAIRGSEMARLLLAHGLPGEYQDGAADAFDFALAAMIAAAGRKGIQNKRNPDVLREQWSDAMRAWGR